MVATIGYSGVTGDGMQLKWAVLALAPWFSGIALADHDHLQELPAVEVTVHAHDSEGHLHKRMVNSPDAAALLQDYTGAYSYQAGGIAALPNIRGMNDNRIRVLVDGAELTAACANSMNAPLTYISPAAVASVNVLAGITPVSMGGDSIAGTITVDSARPVYANSADEWLYQGSFSTVYRSNNNGLSTALNATAASDNLSLNFTSTMDRGQSYRDGNGDKIRATQFERHIQTLTLGAKGEDEDFVLRLSHQEVPHQGFPNQYMDLVGNKADSINASYSREFAWGNLDTRVYWQEVHHEMGFFTSEKPGTMPMKTHGKDMGYNIKATIPLDEAHTLRVGNEFHRQTLDDEWPAVAGSMMMGPNTFVNINDGRRDRIGIFAEVESQWDSRWSSLLGARVDHVRSSTGRVQSYGGMMSAADTLAAANFNAGSRAASDNHVDLTATGKYAFSETTSIEFGYARKTRSPSLYERYSWGVGQMARNMIGWFGDANGYLGNPNLKPEKANTISATLDWHDAESKAWQAKVTPYFTYVQDYIGVEQLNAGLAGNRANLRFDNQDARFYGINMNGAKQLWHDTPWGEGRVKASLAWMRGERINGDSLYQIMPLNARISLEQKKGAWSNGVDVQFVDSKTRVDDARLEPETGGYTLVDLRSSYQWTKARLDFSVTNLFDRYYALPTGGVNYANWKAEGSVGAMGPLAGVGRSVNVGLTVDF
ncbi:iron complex outermembrane recepter protein [Methylobacillus rhizosphaerae]|uniref:Iron complex outermembrane recepter protein n=1 Tax=Methylobacillus rhizosphaerae TaxID=551994 RepID=A0A238Z9L4_9PROT|nr:TonB-dependent receptor [Methylobacillus rhizosphaerae]SNR79404.1 iron complex outermembrane recepter protein [Methylobacillus rhizosphaerae]